MDKTYLLLVVAIIAAGSLLAVSAQVPEPPLPMDEGMITITPLNDGAMLMSSMSGNTTVNIEVHPPVEGEKVVDVVMFDTEATTLTCPDGRTGAVLFESNHGGAGYYEFQQGTGVEMWSSDREPFIDHGALHGFFGFKNIRTTYLIYDISLSEDKSQFIGYGVISNLDIMDTACGINLSVLDISAGTDNEVFFPIRVTGTCGAGLITDVNGTDVRASGTLLIESLSANGYNITSTTPDFYSVCHQYTE